MYTPRYFKQEIDSTVFQFIDQHGFAQIISAQDNVPEVTMVPVMLNEDKTSLLCHVAKQNSHAKLADGQTVVVAFNGPHGYISPSWYQSAGVPTWNYQAVNVYGTVTTFDTAERLHKLVESLTQKYENYQQQPWVLDYPDKMLKAIVGIEITITDIQAKFKLSQNRSPEDIQSVIHQLEARGEHALAQAMRDTNNVVD